MLSAKDYPQQLVKDIIIPSMIEMQRGYDVACYSVTDSDTKKIGFESIIGVKVLMNTPTTIAIPEKYIFGVILAFCEYSKRALLYTLDRKGCIYFYKENHEFAPDTVWGDNTMYIIKNLLKQSRGLELLPFEIGKVRDE